MIEYISSRQNSKIKEVTKLFQMSEKKAQGKFIIEGYHLLEMALSANVVNVVFSLKEEKNVPSSIPQYIITPEILEKISLTKSSQGVVAICLMKEEKEITSNNVLYLDDVSDPGNMGTLLRTALAFGYKDVLVSSNSCSIYNEKVIQASQGAIFSLNVKTCDMEGLKKLKDYQILATEIKGSIDIRDIKEVSKHILVLGNEARGVRKEILQLASQRIRIDIEDMESLNVAIAGGIAMYSLSRLASQKD
jgi:RNA methyltransferase, TrmH family